MAETVTEEVVETTTTTETQTTAPGKTLDELKAENDRLQAALKERNKEEAARRKKLEALEKAEEERNNAALSEQERLKKENETLRARADESARQVLQRDIAAEVGLPPVFAGRIQGADRDAMIEDAKAMLGALPKQGAPALNATNPGSGQSRSETDEQKRARLGLR